MVTRSERERYEQVAAIILTESTFNFGEVEAEAVAVWPAAEVEVDVLDDCSTVQVISTLWPTCGVSFASSASRRYSFATAALGAAPAVPVAPAAGGAVVRRNFGSLMPRAAV